jgi:5-carboxymethyl-2-hydroxymuconate isomerase
VRLITCRTGTGETLGVVAGERWRPAGELVPNGPGTIADLLAGGAAVLAALRSAADAADARIAADGTPLADADLLAPVPRPGKIVAIGRNFREHVAEENTDPPPAPLVFAKFPSSIVGPGDEIRWDPDLTQQVDWEAELGVVIGTAARNVPLDRALDHVLGYTCLHDVTARDLQFGDGQWTRGKSLDTFCPIGPSIVTADEVPDPQDLAISCTVDGEVVQSSRTSMMYFGVAEIIAFCSRSFTLEPGDVIATGTPGGVGAFRTPPRFLGDGSVVTVEIEGIGRLTNTCRHVARTAVAAAAPATSGPAAGGG